MGPVPGLQAGGVANQLRGSLGPFVRPVLLEAASVSDLALRTLQRDAAAGIADAQAAADRVAVRAGLATPAQLYRDAIREGRRRPWTEKQIHAARVCLLELEGPYAPLSRVAVRCSARDPDAAIKAVFRKPDNWRRNRCYQRLRAWAERVLAEAGP